MKLPTKKSKEGYTIAMIRLLIYGPWKIGKSTFASKFKKAMFIGTEKGLKGLKVYKVHVRDWEGFLKAVELFLEGDHDFETCIIDTVDNAFKFCKIFVLNKYKIKHPSDLKWGKGWQLIEEEFARPMLELSNSEYGLILTSHEVENEVNKKGGLKISKITPTFPKQARNVIGPFVDIIGHCYVDEVKVGDEYKERRFIEFEPTPFVEAGDRTGLMPESMSLRYVKFKKCFKKQEEEED